jgi:hypothetical protein
MTEDDGDQDGIGGLDDGLKFTIPPRSDPTDFGDGTGFLQVEEIREASCPDSYESLHQTPQSLNTSGMWGGPSSQPSSQQQQQLQQSLMMSGSPNCKLGIRDGLDANADSMTGSNQDIRDSGVDVSAAQDQNNLNMQAHSGLSAGNSSANSSGNMPGQGWLKEEPPMIPATAPQPQPEQSKTTKSTRTRRGSQNQLSVNTASSAALTAQNSNSSSNNNSTAGLAMGMNAAAMPMGGAPSPRHITQVRLHVRAYA